MGKERENSTLAFIKGITRSLAKRILGAQRAFLLGDITIDERDRVLDESRKFETTLIEPLNPQSQSEN